MNNKIIGLSIALVLLISGCATSELSPARDLTGTWKTAFPVNFYIKTDFLTGNLEEVGSEERMMEWVISPGAGENEVNIDISFIVNNRTLVTGSGYTPDIPLMSLKGDVESSSLTLRANNGRVIGVFSFTSDLMMGTWNDSWSMAYSQEVYTHSNELKLVRE